MRIRKNKDGSNTFCYSNPLEAEIEKCRGEQEKMEREIPFAKYSYEEAKKAYMRKTNRLENLKSFIELAEKEMEKQSVAKDTTATTST
jgi:chromosome segregation ATPase